MGIILAKLRMVGKKYEWMKCHDDDQCVFLFLLNGTFEQKNCYIHMHRQAVNMYEVRIEARQ